MTQNDTQNSKLNRRGSSLRENLLRRKKAVKSRDENDKQKSLSHDKPQRENDSFSS